MERGTSLTQRKGLAEDSPTPSSGMQWVPGGCSGTPQGQDPERAECRSART